MWDIEITDTFGGESNYSWVKNYSIPYESVKTRQALMRKAKSLAGWTGIRSEVTDFGDMIEVRPRNLCQIMFITYKDTP